MAIRPKPLSPAEAFATLHSDLMLERRVAFPAQITAVNVDSGDGALKSIDVLPMIRETLSQENTDELIYRDLPILANVPVVFPHSTISGFSFTVPVQVGDHVLIVIADRSIDEWQESGVIGRPVESTTPRAHDLTDAIAIIGISSDVNNVKQYDFDKACIRNGDKTKRVCVSDTSIEVVSGSSTVVVDDNSITLSAGGSSIVIDGSGVTITGTPVTINGVNFSAHTHISNGAGNPTDPPV